MTGNKNVLLGITGSIAAYKTPDLVRKFIKAGCDVRVIMTPSATQFVSPLSLSTVSRNEIFTNINDDKQWNNHVELGLWADVMVIAPASANTIAKMANGICDNLLLACYLSARCPVVIAPAMDLDMYHHSTTQQNLATLKSNGVQIIGPGYGDLASGLKGDGRMEEPEAIAEGVLRFMNSGKKWQGKQVVVTAGPTREAIDPVRFISNYSSGKMGVAIAEESLKRGASVILILGKGADNYTNEKMEILYVDSAHEMLNASIEVFNTSDVFIMAAAVADYAPTHIADKKIKKSEHAMHIELKKTTDVLALLGEQKRNQFLVGFALETDNEIENALAKLKRKNLDMIILNSLQHAGAGFGTDTNRISIIDKDGTISQYEMKTKSEVARDILDHIDLLKEKKS